MDRDKIVLGLKTPPSQSELQIFFEVNKSDNFRYFDKRSFDVVKNHKYTCIYFIDDNNVGYGHTDREDGKNWLGIFVSKIHRGYGLGKLIMVDLMKQSDGDIYLTVDIDNINAINLYKKMGFKESEKVNNKYYLMVYKNKKK